MSLRDRLSRYADGVHRLGEPAYVLDAGLPKGLAAVYRELDGGELFHEALVLVPSASVAPGEGGRLRIGEVDGDDLYVDASTGSVWRLEKDTEEWLEEGSAADRWLLGWVDGQEVLFDLEGEFNDGVFDEDGELVAEAAMRRERKLLKRDKGASAPRWRLARALVQRGELELARDQLEEVVAARPTFAWAWYDLARLSERLGNLEGAIEEAREAASCDPDYAHAGFFWAHVARLCAHVGDDNGRRVATEHALERSPDLVRIHRDAATDDLVHEDRESAREHLAIALALAPRDIELLDMKKHLSDPAFDADS